MDTKSVMVMSTNSQPSGMGAVLRRQQDGSQIQVPCPDSIICYNQHMGWVDHGDQLRGYYGCRSKSRKFYKYIFTFLLDVSVTNSFILMKHFANPPPFVNIKAYRIQVANELMAEYCSRHRRGRGGSIIHPLPYRHFPTRCTNETSTHRHTRGQICEG